MDQSETQHLAPDDANAPPAKIHNRIGVLTRTLHDALHELGFDEQLKSVQSGLPDARDRLSYITRVTGEAAEKVLNAVDRARALQDELGAEAARLRTRWQAVAVFMARGERELPASKQLVDDTCAFLSATGGQIDVTNGILTDIMMAQDFHDLTSQVVRKVIALASKLEEQLLHLLLETTSPEQRRKIAAPELEGPVVNAAGRDDVVTDQAGVDDLLASLGF